MSNYAISEDKDKELTWDEVRSRSQIKNWVRDIMFSELQSGETFVEYGSGGSSLSFIEKIRERDDGCKLVSIEHHEEWYESVKKVTEEATEFTLLHKPNKYPLTVRDGKYTMQIPTYATPFEENPAGMQEYMIPKEINWSEVGVVLVDGICRASVLASVWHYIKDGATVYLHDTDGRDWYDWALSLYRDVDDVYHNMKVLKK